MDAQLAGPGAEQIPANADVVAEVEQFVELEGVIADRVLLNVNLQTLAVLLQVRETGFAHQANGHDAARHSYVHRRALEFLGGAVAVACEDLGNGVSELEAGGIS